MLRVQTQEGDVIGHVHDHGDDVFLADAHLSPEVITVFGEDFGLENLGRKVQGVGVEVLQEALEVGGLGSGDESGTAPVVKDGSGEGFTRGWIELLNDQFAATQANVALRIGSREGEECILRLMLEVETRLDRTDIGVEGREGFWRWLGGKAECGGEDHQAAKNE